MITHMFTKEDPPNTAAPDKQMLDKPDKVGVWAIYFEGAFIGIDFFDNLKEIRLPKIAPDDVFIEARREYWGIKSGHKFYFMW